MKYEDIKELDVGIVCGGLFDFLDKLTDLFDEYCIDEVNKCDDGIILKSDEGEIIFDHYENGMIKKLKIQSEYDSYYRYGDPFDGIPQPRVLNKTPEEQKENNELIKGWYEEKLHNAKNKQDKI